MRHGHGHGCSLGCYDMIRFCIISDEGIVIGVGAVGSADGFGEFCDGMI